jgi:hypothetical protein
MTVDEFDRYPFVIGQRPMSYAIQRETLSPEHPIRYNILNDSGGLLYTVERTNPYFDLNQQPIRFLNPAGEPVAELIPPEDRNLWRATNAFQIALSGEEQPRYIIEQSYTLVDRILLRAPRYKLFGGGVRYVVRGSRHGEHFYEFFDGKDNYLGRIERPASGPTYLIESDEPALMQLPLLLAALAIVIDFHLAEAEA